MWTIKLIRNEPVITKRCARDLFKAQEYEGEVWNSLDEVTCNGHLAFTEGHREGMDCLDSDSHFAKVLCRHRVKGDLCFGSLEGDDAGCFWGYRFDGAGHMTELVGRVDFTEKQAARRRCRK